MRWRRNPSDRPGTPALTRNERFHAWVLSLPWVVERTELSESLGVRAFAIACEPLDIRQLWLVTGVQSRIAVVVPEPMARSYEAERLGRAIAPMPAFHTLFGIDADTPAIDVERAVLEAYGAALAS